ncbi:MAG: AraC family transcriptional regulator [Salinisphaera sp.]|uniref:AraC family transcriptional regulator n=1 Tax=Salinisphaera sp. TaxID=1914330 RepID=UPI003C7A206D
MNQTHARLNPIRRGCGEHRHSFAQLLFGLSGVVRCEMAAGAFDVSVDRIGIVPNAARHFFAGRSEDSRLLVVDLFLDDHAVRDIERVEPQSGFRELFEAPRAISAPADLRSLITCAASQLARMPVGSRLMAQQWATMLAVQVHRLLAAPSLAPTRSKRERFHDLVDARLATPPSNTELERHLNMSGSALNQWCRAHFGMPPQRAVLARRLGHAHDRLRYSEQSIAQIAHDTGFADAPSFTRAFVRVHGTTPGAVRRSLPHDRVASNQATAVDRAAEASISYTA